MNFDVHMLTGPVIGAVIGYFTNSIAVKMLFRPLHPVKIGNFTLPFTPGLIPKGQSRLAKAIGDTVGTQLLTEEVLTNQLLSVEMKEDMKQSILHFLEDQTENESSIYEVLEPKVSSENILKVKDACCQKVVEKVDEYQKKIGLGRIVADQVIAAVKEYVQGTLLAMMVNDDLLEKVGATIEERFASYMEGEGKEIISAAMQNEADQMLYQSIFVYANAALPYKEMIADLVVSMYQSIVQDKMKEMIEKLNISKVVEDKINQMDVEEVEELVLSIMKKELGAVVNLGAVIGFVIGILNTIL